MRRASLAAAAIASAATLAVSAAPALAAGHAPGHAHHHTVNDHGQHGRSHGRLAHQIQGASHVVAGQLRQVTRMLEVATNSDKVSDTDRDAVVSALQADLAALTALQTQLASAATHHDVVGALHQGILVRVVARTQLTVAAQAGAVRNAAATSADSAAAGTAGTDADNAVAAVLALTPDSTRADIHIARSTAEADLADAEGALGAATGDGSGGGGSTSTTTADPTP